MSNLEKRLADMMTRELNAGATPTDVYVALVSYFSFFVTVDRCKSGNFHTRWIGDVLTGMRVARQHPNVPASQKTPSPGVAALRDELAPAFASFHERYSDVGWAAMSTLLELLAEVVAIQPDAVVRKLQRDSLIARLDERIEALVAPMLERVARAAGPVGHA